MPNLPSWEASRIYTTCEDEVPDKHLVVSHLLTPPPLAVCYECFSWRDTWDDLANEYFFAHVERWQDAWKGVRRRTPLGSLKRSREGNLPRPAPVGPSASQPTSGPPRDWMP